MREKSGGGGFESKSDIESDGRGGLDTVKVKIYTLTYHIIYMTVSILVLLIISAQF